MTRYPDRRIPDGQSSLRRRKAARLTSMTVGLMIAAFVTAAMAATLFRPHKSLAPQNTSHASVITSHKVVALHRLAELAMAGVADPLEPTSVVLDPNGEILVADSSNGRISAWSTSSGRPLSTFATLPNGVPASSEGLGTPAFSADGKEFAVTSGPAGGPEAADVWNVTTGRATAVPLASGSSNSPLVSAAPGPSGLVVDTYTDNTLGLASAATGQSDAMAVLHGGATLGPQLGEPTFSPDGGTIAISDDLGTVHLVSVSARRLVAALTAEEIYNNVSPMNSIFSKEIDSVTFSPDSQSVACGTESGIVRVWDVATGRNVAAFGVSGSAPDGAPARPVKTLVFSPDGKTVITADDADGTLAEWDVATGREVATFSAGTGNVTAAAFTAAGKLVVATTSGAAGGTIEIWSQ